MIGVGVGDEGAGDGVPRVDVEVARFAVEAVFVELEEWHRRLMIGTKGYDVVENLTTGSGCRKGQRQRTCITQGMVGVARRRRGCSPRGLNYPENLNLTTRGAALFGVVGFPKKGSTTRVMGLCVDGEIVPRGAAPTGVRDVGAAPRGLN